MSYMHTRAVSCSASLSCPQVKAIGCERGSPIVTLSNLAVLNTERGKGIGKQILCLAQVRRKCKQSLKHQGQSPARVKTSSGFFHTGIYASLATALRSLLLPLSVQPFILVYQGHCACVQSFKEMLHISWGNTTIICKRRNISICICSSLLQPL